MLDDCVVCLFTVLEWSVSLLLIVVFSEADCVRYCLVVSIVSYMGLIYGFCGYSLEDYGVLFQSFYTFLGAMIMTVVILIDRVAWTFCFEILSFTVCWIDRSSIFSSDIMCDVIII